MVVSIDYSAAWDMSRTPGELVFDVTTFFTSMRTFRQLSLVKTWCYTNSIFETEDACHGDVVFMPFHCALLNSALAPSAHTHIQLAIELTFESIESVNRELVLLFPSLFFVMRRPLS